MRSSILRDPCRSESYNPWSWSSSRLIMRSLIAMLGSIVWLFVASSVAIECAIVWCCNRICSFARYLRDRAIIHRNLHCRWMLIFRALSCKQTTVFVRPCWSQTSPSRASLQTRLSSWSGGDVVFRVALQQHTDCVSTIGLGPALSCTEHTTTWVRLAHLKGTWLNWGHWREDEGRPSYGLADPDLTILGRQAQALSCNDLFKTSRAQLSISQYIGWRKRWMVLEGRPLYGLL
jgi:hypothetical protein